MTVAALGLAVDSSSVETATPALQKMTAAAGQAEAAAQRLAGASKLEASSTAAATAAAQMHAVALRAQASASRLLANDTRMLGYQINDVVVSLASGMNPGLVLLQQGSQVAQIGMRNLAAAGASLIRSFAPVLALVAALGVGVAAMTGEINKNQKVQVGWTDVVVAGWQKASSAIMDEFKPALDAIAGWWDAAAPMIVTGINKLVGLFVGAYQFVKASWGNLPAALGDIAIRAVNELIKGVATGLDELRTLINSWLVKLPNGIGRNLQIGGARELYSLRTNDAVPNPFQGAGDDGMAAFGAAMNRDYVGEIGALARANVAAADSADKSNAAHKRLAHEGLSEAQKEAQRLADTIENTLGSALASLFDGPINSLQDALDGIFGSFGQLGQQNLQNTFDGLFSAPANDNGGWSEARAKVFGKSMGEGFGDFLKNNASNIGAGIGGLGIGYQTQNPLMGAVGGALAGASAGPWGAVIGGVAGIVGGLIGMNAELEKNRKLLADNKQSISAFIGAGFGDEIDKTTAAVIQYKAQAAEYIKLAQAAGDTALVKRLQAAAAAYKDTLRAQDRMERAEDRVAERRDTLREAYEREADALRGVIDQNRAFAESIRQFKNSLLLDSSLSPLSPQDRLIEARSQFQRISDAAMGGDANAQGQLQGAASSYLEMARGFYASSSAYAAIFEQVQSVLDQAATGADTRASAAELQLQLNEQTVGKLIDLNTTAVSMDKALKDLLAEAKRQQTITANAANQNIAAAEKQLAAVNKMVREISAALAKR